MFLPARTRPLFLALLIACVAGAGCSKGSDSPGGETNVATGGGGSATGGRAGSGGSSASGSGGVATGGSPGSGGVSGSGGSAAAGSGGSVTGTGGTSPGTGGASSDAAPADAPPSEDAPSQPVPPVGGVRKVIILHDANAGGSAGDPSRKSLVDIIESMKATHGFVVTMMNSPTKASEMMDASIIIVGPNSSMFGANHPDPGLKTIPIPLMVSKDGNTTEIGLGKVGATAPPNFNKINIIKTDHPLAAGLAMGSITVLTTPNAQRIITFTGIGPDAIKIATGPQSADTYSIIAYEKGGDMGGGVKAPAKRVGFFWHRPAAATPDGIKLMKAALDWMTKP